jgi:large subunit ribosomal protein L15
MPLYRRLPKKGFTNPGRRDEIALNLGDLERLPGTVKEVTLASLAEAGLAKGRHDRLVILGNGEISRALTVKAHRVSASAREKIAKAGGSVELIAIPGAQKRERKAKKAE